MIRLSKGVSLRNILASAAIGALLLPLTSIAAPTSTGPYIDPPVLASQGNILDLLMVAAKRSAVTLGGVTTDLYTYEVCRTTTAPTVSDNVCPSPGYTGLSGTRLALNPGDTLNIRLVNKLPAANTLDTPHIADQPLLVNNPTNLHTHGFIVEPHRSTGNSDPYGDYIFVDVLNTANPIPPGSHPGVDYARNAAAYSYTLDKTHPPGLFWYHPHVHGISMNQVTAGMAGPITVGTVGDLCGDDACRAALANMTVRHLVLKDTQIAPNDPALAINHGLKTDLEPSFCGSDPNPATLNGYCAGDPTVPTFAGGTWLHTVSGQVYPSIAMAPAGEVWRIFQMGASRSYKLQVLDTTNGAKTKLLMQILSIDGITIKARPNATARELATLFNGKLELANCPTQNDGSICATTVYAMPSSRVDLRVLPTKTTRTAIFRTAVYNTGPSGDTWPAVNLASLTVAAPTATAMSTVATQDMTSRTLTASGQLLAPATIRTVKTASAMATSALQDVTMAMTTAITPAQVRGQIATPNCTPLAPGHRRRITFGYPTDTTFGLGYVEVDAAGNEIPSTRIPVSQFDADKITVCVPLKGGNATYELWELQNVTPEDHNFHIHQTRFFVVGGTLPPGQTLPQLLDGNLVLNDNVPLPRSTDRPANCTGVTGGASPAPCKPNGSTFLVIPFREVGDFVFHCHILEHEDGGMMARIRVVPTP